MDIRDKWEQIWNKQIEGAAENQSMVMELKGNTIMDYDRQYADMTSSKNNEIDTTVIQQQVQQTEDKVRAWRNQFDTAIRVFGSVQANTVKVVKNLAEEHRTVAKVANEYQVWKQLVMGYLATQDTEFMNKFEKSAIEMSNKIGTEWMMEERKKS